ncbi:zinc finger CCCH domain-containing protein 12-like [Phalaenopsis equestris]|uniref:zinc finger CCCH domain-containing protein 12-like n=1 Tax=Phalaenopsis equestris TaxID=78828 RepID=UPI0009E317DC|nr:zinc finger CCCH domain-containing protein 12-like [Phalaenopsis equestris]
MPDTGEFQSNALSAYSNASTNHNLDESMRRLKVEGNYDEVDAYANPYEPYPDRPGEPDCIYYIKTGSCGYGSTCRYNHPTYVGQGTRAKGELPERVGQPDCQYFLRTGMCKFGATCKYHHPRDRQDARALGFNIFGFPMRQDEKSCSYYMRTGTCKFGVACKFDHPQPAPGAVYPLTLTGSPAYRSTISSVAPTPSMPFAGGISSWPSANGQPYMSSPRMQCLPAYVPVIIPTTPGTIPGQQGWSNYTGDVSQVTSPEVVGHTKTPKSKNKAQPSPSYIENLPERPDQPDCQYYLRTGSCKYGSTCKYHHPKDRISSAIGFLGPLGLPLRPGHAVCSFYSMYGTCRFGSACRFDHPLISYYNYALPEIYAPDPSSWFSNQSNPQTTLISFDVSPPKVMKSEVTDEALPSDSDEYRNPPAQATSPPHTALSSESPLNQSD